MNELVDRVIDRDGARIDASPAAFASAPAFVRLPIAATRHGGLRR
jgi:hypothetical protein